MADGMTTRQKKISQLQKDLEKIKAKLDSTANQLRTEMHMGMEALGADIRKVLELVMLKHDAPTKTNGTEDSSSSRVAEGRLKAVLGVRVDNRINSQSLDSCINLTEARKFQLSIQRLFVLGLTGVTSRDGYSR